MASRQRLHVMAALHRLRGSRELKIRTLTSGGRSATKSAGAPLLFLSGGRSVGSPQVSDCLFLLAVFCIIQSSRRVRSARLSEESATVNEHPTLLSPVWSYGCRPGGTAAPSAEPHCCLLPHPFSPRPPQAGPEPSTGALRRGADWTARSRQAADGRSSTVAAARPLPPRAPVPVRLWKRSAISAAPC